MVSLSNDKITIEIASGSPAEELYHAQRALIRIMQNASREDNNTIFYGLELLENMLPDEAQMVKAFA